MEKRYTLITGATGFIGSHVASRLFAESYPLIAIVRKTSHYNHIEELKRSGVILIEGTFYDRGLIENTFRDFPIENVIHIAALRGGGMGTNDDYRKINVLGTEILLQVSLQYAVKRFIFMSSVGVLGTIPDHLPGNVASKYHADNLYHESKILAEQKVLEYIEKGLDAYILRPAITYGAGDDGFPKTLVRLIKKHMLLLPAGDIKIHLLDVAALTDLIISTLQTNRLQEKVFIAADANPISLRMLANKIYEHYHKKKYPYYLRLPNSVYRGLLRCFILFHSEKWAVRFQLIANDWYYDIGPTVKELSFKPADTSESFVKSMCN